MSCIELCCVVLLLQVPHSLPPRSSIAPDFIFRFDSFSSQSKSRSLTSPLLLPRRTHGLRSRYFFLYLFFRSWCLHVCVAFLFPCSLIWMLSRLIPMCKTIFRFHLFTTHLSIYFGFSILCVLADWHDL